MTRTQQTALAAGAATVGLALVNRAWRSTRRLDFHGKVVVMTGARGLAINLARQLGAEGARIVLAARDQSELDRARDELRTRGVEISTVACDLMSRAQMNGLVAQAVERYG